MVDFKYESFEVSQDEESEGKAQPTIDRTASSSVSKSFVGTLSLKRMTVAHVDSRTQLYEDEEDGKRCEVWVFDDDAYTLGLCSLFEKGLRSALPYAILGFCVSLLQFYIVVQVVHYIAEHHHEADKARLPVRAICSALCLIQLSDESVEGLHKVIFAIRWSMGTYAGNSCVVCALLGAFLGVLQVMGGILTCLINIQVIFHSTTILDTFFNYVALAFIADIDNIIVNSRLMRSFKTVNTEIRARCAGEEKLQVARERWPVMVTIVTAALYLLMAVMQSFTGMNTTSFATVGDADDQGLPGFAKGLATWLLGNVVLLSLSHCIGPCRAAYTVTGGLFLFQIVLFVHRVQAADPGCTHVGMYMRLAFFIFQLTTVPMSLALEEQPFAVFKVIPCQIKSLMVVSLAYVYEMRHFKC